MASHQVSKKDSKQETHAEEPKVLKLAQHFEGLGKDSDEGAHREEKEEAHSLEDVGKFRAQAQQNSMEAIRCAEERYEKAKNEAMGELLKDAKQQPGDQGQGGGKKETHETTGHSVKDRPRELTGRGGDEQGHEKAKLGEVLKDSTEQYMGSAAGQEAGRGDSKKVTPTQGEQESAEHYMDAPAGEENPHLEGQHGSDYTTAAKDTIFTVGKTVVDYTKQAADVAASTGAPAIHFIGEKAVGVKDTALHVGKAAAGTTAEIGKSAAGYAGTKAVQAKDVVVETGLRAAHFTLQKAVQVTEGTADVGHKAVEYTGQKTEEVKQESAHKGQEAQEHVAETKKEVEQKETPKYDEYKEEAEQPGPEVVESHAAKQGSSWVGAVGEALTEIAQTTKKMVMVKDPDQKE